MKYFAILIFISLILYGLSCQSSTSPKEESPTVIIDNGGGNNSGGNNGGGNNGGGNNGGGNNGGGNNGGGNNNGRILLVDQKNKEWDITHAVENYGFVPEDFQFGIGLGIIKPIFDPEFISFGDPGFPDENETYLVLGYTQDNDARAYPIADMSRHEVVNDIYGSTHLTVAY